MSEDGFKLTEEMIKEIEEKVNARLEEVKGMKERLINAGCYNDWSFFAACWITIDIENSKIKVIDPIKSDDDDDDEEEEDDLENWD
jgi:hypothetical protein